MFVVCEGANGVGKTSLIKNFSNAGYSTLSSPNGTPLAKMLRPACRGTEPWTDIDKRIQFMLFSAARLDEYIRCVHNKNEVVIADRWWTSTYVYQCMLQGLSVDFLEHTVHPEEQLDLVILMDGNDDTLINRVISEREANPEHGTCRWTKERETMLELIRLYRDALPPYLKSRRIPVEIIDTTDLTTEEVFETSKALIKKYGG